MRVKDWMSSTLITVTPETGVSAAWDLMRERGVRHLLVGRGHRLAGILSDRDIRLALPSPATSLSSWEISHLLMNLRVDSIMTRSLITIEPSRLVSEAATLMLAHRIGALPVVDAQGVRGIITQTDVLRAFPSAPGVLREAGGLREATDDQDGPGPAEGSILHTILVPLAELGDHHRVLAAARVLAKRAPARLRLVRVTRMPEAGVDGNGKTLAYSDQESARVEHEVLKDLRVAAADVRDVPLECVVRFGDPVDEIVSEAESANVDLIVMATHRRTGVRRLLQGSIAEDVERATTRPVLLVPYDEDGGAGNAAGPAMSTEAVPS